MTNVSAKSADLRLATVAGTSVLISIVSFALGQIGLVPSGVSTVIVLVGVSIGLRVAWSYAAKSASSASREKTMLLISNVGLGISGLSVVASLPRITQGAGILTFLIDVLSQVWTLAILTVAAGPVRTLGWRAFAGATLTGFLAITALARFVGVPVLQSLGTSNVFGSGIWVPITEEFFKLIPVAIVLVLALRRSASRPSALDVMLVGAFTGAGFALYENAALARGGFSIFTNPIVSLFFPSSSRGEAFYWPLAQTGHLVHTALIALAVAFYVFYGRTVRRSWAVPLVAIASVLFEHCLQNAIVAGGVDEVVAKIAVVLMLGGYLTMILLIAGVAYVLWFEWRIVGGTFDAKNWFSPSAAEVGRRSARLARAQTDRAT
jgi:RsiW-degrading membrane proteinase PrsW (M82 family)